MERKRKLKNMNKHNNRNYKMKGLSLFSCGGISEYYLADTDIEIKVANELISERCQFYNLNYPNVDMIEGDITNEEVFQRIMNSSIHEGVEFIIATPPCQTFSNAGARDMNDLRTNLISYVFRSITTLKPKYVLIENVPAFIKSKIPFEFEFMENEPPYVVRVLFEKFCETSGYHFEWKILNSKDFETPQSRKRCIILLSRKDVKVWKHPGIVTKTPLTVRQTIGHLPSIESGESTDIKWHFARKHADRHILWMRHTPTGKSAFENEIHFPQKSNGERIRGYGTTYKRIDWDSPCPTITMSSGSISSQNNVHPGRLLEDGTYSDARAMSVYELLLLNGLDDKWIHNGIDLKQEKLIRDLLGESFPPKFAYHIISSLPKN